VEHSTRETDASHESAEATRETDASRESADATRETDAPHRFDPEELAAAVELAMDIVGAELVFQKLHEVVSREVLATTRGFGNEAFVNYYKMFHHLDLDLDKSLTVDEFVKDVREGLKLDETTITTDDLEKLFFCIDQGRKECEIPSFKGSSSRPFSTRFG
jgi:hypothetical protein